MCPRCALKLHMKSLLTRPRGREESSWDGSPLPSTSAGPLEVTGCHEVFNGCARFPQGVGCMGTRMSLPPPRPPTPSSPSLPPALQTQLQLRWWMKQAGAYTSGLIYGGRPALLSPRLSAHGAVHAIRLWGVGGGHLKLRWTPRMFFWRLELIAVRNEDIPEVETRHHQKDHGSAVPITFIDVRGSADPAESWKGSWPLWADI